MADRPVPRSPKLAFWIHQVVEYGLAIVVLSQGAQAGAPVPAGIAAGALVLLAVTAQAPLGAFRVVSRPVHRVLDIVVVVALVLVAVGFRDELGTGGLIVLGASAFALAVLVIRTDYTPPRPRRSPGTPAGPTTGEELGRAAGRVVGRGIHAYRRRSK